MSHEEPGAADHSYSVEWNTYCSIESCPILGLGPRVYVLLSHSFYFLLF